MTPHTFFSTLVITHTSCTLSCADGRSKQCSGSPIPTPGVPHQSNQRAPPLPVQTLAHRAHSHPQADSLFQGISCYSLCPHSQAAAAVIRPHPQSLQPLSSQRFEHAPLIFLCFRPSFFGTLVLNTWAQTPRSQSGTLSLSTLAPTHPVLLLPPKIACYGSPGCDCCDLPHCAQQIARN